jgi:hypothetical protein
MAEISDLELLDALGVEAEPDKKAARSSREQRIIAGFEEVQKFVEQHESLPSHGEGKNIFERLYSSRLDQIRKQSECRDLVTEMDYQGLLEGATEFSDELPADIDDEELLSQLGVDAPSDDIMVLNHVRSRAEVRAAEEIANRTKCEDFETFKPLFAAIQSDLDAKIRETQKFRKDAGFLKSDIKIGQFFILGGQIAYVASVGEAFKASNGSTDARLRVIYSNGTENDILLRSMQRALYKDEGSRFVSEPNAGPLFSSEHNEEDLASGTIYILRSKSDQPVVRENRDVVHKIGVTGGNVEKRIANAEHDPTFLLAGVKIVATYELFNINRVKLESLIHKIFEAARLDIEIIDRFGQPVVPREWFLVPLFAIDEAVERIKDGTISSYEYDTVNARLVFRNEGPKLPARE